MPLTNFYSSSTTLTIGSKLFQDPALTIPCTAGFYSNGVNCFQVDGSGTIIAVLPCVLNRILLRVLNENSTDIYNAFGGNTSSILTTASIDDNGVASSFPTGVNILSTSGTYGYSQLKDNINSAGGATVTLQLNPAPNGWCSDPGSSAVNNYVPEVRVYDAANVERGVRQYLTAVNGNSATINLAESYFTNSSGPNVNSAVIIEIHWIQCT